MPELLTVHVTFVFAVFSPTASVEPRAVVRNDGTAIFSPAVSCVPAMTAPAAVVVVKPVPA